MNKYSGPRLRPSEGEEFPRLLREELDNVMSTQLGRNGPLLSDGQMRAFDGPPKTHSVKKVLEDLRSLLREQAEDLWKLSNAFADRAGQDYPPHGESIGSTLADCHTYAATSGESIRRLKQHIGV